MSYDDTKQDYCWEREPIEILDVDGPDENAHAEAIRRHPQRPLDDFEVRRTASGAFEVVFCGSRYDRS